MLIASQFANPIFLTRQLIPTVMLDIGLEVIVYNQKGFFSIRK